MKQNKRKKAQAARAAARRADPKAQAEAQAELRDAQRRRTLVWLRNGAIALPFVGLAGWGATRSFQARLAEGDLTRIGQGAPTVVQIHDPQCGECRSLQRETRAAIKSMGDDAPVYLVADLNSVDGAALAARNGVSRVTLLLFDAEGRVQQVVRGVQQADALEALFRVLVTGRG